MFLPISSDLASSADVLLARQSDACVFMQICYHSFYSSLTQKENLTLKNVGQIHFQLDMNSVTEN